MLLNADQIIFLLGRLKWEPVYEDRALVVAKKRGGGYSDDPTIAKMEGALSIMLEAASKIKNR